MMKKRSTLEEALLAANLGDFISKSSKTQEAQKPQPKVLIQKSQVQHENPNTRKSRWDYEVPDLDLDTMYGRVNRLMQRHLVKKRQIKNRGANDSSTGEVDQFGTKQNPALNDYITRSFSKCRGRPNYEKEMTGLLKMVTDQSKMIGDMESRDWNAFPLPLLSHERLNMMNVGVNGFQVGYNPGINFIGPALSGIRTDNSAYLSALYAQGIYTSANPNQNLGPNGNNSQNQYLQQQMIKQQQINYQLAVEQSRQQSIQQSIASRQNNTVSKEDLELMYGLNSGVSKNKAQLQQQHKKDIKPESNVKQKQNQQQPKNQKGKNANSSNSLQSRMDTELYIDMIRAQGKNKSISEDDRSKFIETNSYFNQIKSNINLNDDNADLILMDMLKIEGKSQKLEKKYFRLTEMPDPSDVRPLEVLQKSLPHILNKFAEKKVDALWVQDQFRSIRLDLGIQRIKDEFTLKVYEENALFCLKVLDDDQFNKCLMQANELYDEGISGRKYEFMMYRALYLALSGEKGVLIRYFKELKPSDLKSKPMQAVLKLISNLTKGNIAFVFRQLSEGNEGTKLLLQMFILKLRIWALQILCKSYGKTISFENLSNILAFNNTDECVEFLKEIDCSLDMEKKVLVFNLSRANINSHPKMNEKFD